jgi:hypothetical protein
LWELGGGSGLYCYAGWEELVKSAEPSLPSDLRTIAEWGLNNSFLPRKIIFLQVDAIHMAMNTYARMGSVTGHSDYFSKQFANFNASVLAKADHKNTFGFWNATDSLFYRDDRFLGTQV